MPLAEHGLEWVHPEAAYAHPLPDGDAKLLYRDPRTADRRERRRPQWVEVRQAVPGQLRRRAGDDADRLPAARRPDQAARRAPARCGCSTSRGCCPAAPSGSASACSRTPARARGSTAPRCTATRRRTAPGSAIAAFYLNLLGHAVGWPSPKGGAQQLTDALVALLREPRRRDPHQRAGDAASSARAAASPASRPPTSEYAAKIVIGDVMPRRLAKMADLPKLVPTALRPLQSSARPR